MYYRMSTYKIRRGKEDELFEIADRLRPELKALPGIKNVHAVKLSDDTYMTVAIYDSSDSAEAAAETAKGIWGQMANCIDLGTMIQQAGEVTWKL